MRASFSSRCDEYYNLKMLLIGEKFRSKVIIERRQAAVKNGGQIISKSSPALQLYVYGGHRMSCQF